MGHISRNIDPSSPICLIIENLQEIVKKSVHLPDSIQDQNKLKWISLGIYKQPISSLRSGTDEIQEVINLMLSEKRKMEAAGYQVYFLDDFIANFPDKDYYNGSLKEHIEHLCEIQGNHRYLGGVDKTSLIGIMTKYTTTLDGQILSSNWYQYDDYGEYTPNGYAGCVAVAVGQIMYYHRYPANIAWNLMDPNYSTATTAHFLADLGVSLNMVYRPDGSYSNINEALKVFKKKGYRNASIRGSSDDDWNLVFQNLKANHPVYIRGNKNGENTGHAWVLDAYKRSNATILLYARVLEDTPPDYLPLSYLTVFDNVIDNITHRDIHMNLGWYPGTSNIYYDMPDYTNDIYDNPFPDQTQFIVNIYPTM